ETAAGRGRLALRRTTATRRWNAGASATSAAGPRTGTAAAAAALRTQAAEDLHRLGIEAARTPLAGVRQAIRVETHVAHQGRMGDAVGLADLGQRRQPLRSAGTTGGPAAPDTGGAAAAGSGGTAAAGGGGTATAGGGGTATTGCCRSQAGGPPPGGACRL